VHGRTRVAALFTVLACSLPASALAAPIPAGDYTVKLTGGTLALGSLPSIPLGASSDVPVTIGTSPIGVHLDGYTVPAAPITGIPGTTGTYTITVQTLDLTVDPASGGATIDTGSFVTFDVTLTIAPFPPLSGSCTIGTAQAPVALHLSTATPGGSPWDATTHAFTLVDNTFVMPAISCDPSLSTIAGFIAAFVGGTNPGDNVLTMAGTLIARPVSTTGGGGAGGGGGTSGGTQQPATQTPTGTQAPTTQAAPEVVKGCVVPKLKGKSFKTRKAKTKLKRRLKRAGCRLGKVKKAKSHKRKGTVVKQSPRPGKKLKQGTRVSLTVSRGAN
jgi:PASTA domain